MALPTEEAAASILEQPNSQTKASLTNAQRFKALHAAARFGNYHSYYTKFREQNVPDTRLAIIPSSVLHGARVLDLGCNAGKLTMEVLEHFQAKSAVGVDLDPYLIEQAKTLYSPDKRGDLTFELLDIMDLSENGPWDTAPVLTTQSYDIVFLFSITKWLHLNHGDKALLRLFEQIHRILTPGGYLVVEPQGWENYARAAKKNATLRPMYKEIRLRPPFREQLEVIGFVRIVDVDRDEFGFERSVHVWKKNDQAKTLTEDCG